jgi:hypothetical protein
MQVPTDGFARFHRDISDDDLLDAIARVAAEPPRPPASRRFTVLLGLTALVASVPLLGWVAVTTADLHSGLSSPSQGPMLGTADRGDRGPLARPQIANATALQGVGFADRSMFRTELASTAAPRADAMGWERDWQELTSILPDQDGYLLQPTIALPTFAQGSAPAPDYTPGPSPPALPNFVATATVPSVIAEASVPSVTAQASAQASTSDLPEATTTTPAETQVRDADASPSASGDSQNKPHQVRPVPVLRDKVRAHQRSSDETHVASAKPHRSGNHAEYVEQYVEQGDAGKVQFHYRRRSCTPGNMVDVCYMPAENRREIVVQHY